MPAPSCLTTDWANNSLNSRFVVSFDDRAAQYSPAVASFLDPTATVQPYGEVCFSPRGRTFVRYGPADPWLPLAGVLRVEVLNSQTQFVRLVVIPPNGVARVVARVGP